jgi:hypothetical protein
MFVLCLFHLTIVLSVMGQCLSFVFFIWPLYCLLWVNVCPLSFWFIQWSNEKEKGQTLTHNRQYNGKMKKKKDKHWPITDNAMVKWKRQRSIVCYGSMFVLCVFHLTIVLSVMGQCLSFVFFIWPLYCLLWVNVCPLSFSFDHCIICYGSMLFLFLFYLTIVFSVNQ